MNGKKITGITLLSLLVPLFISGIAYMHCTSSEAVFMEAIGSTVTIFYGAGFLVWLIWVIFWLFDADK